MRGALPWDVTCYKDSTRYVRKMHVSDIPSSTNVTHRAKAEVINLSLNASLLKQFLLNI